MPGLNQLKKFSNDTKNLGNELKEKQKRGEPIEEVPLPSGIPEGDDSDDFLLGLPVDAPSGDDSETSDVDNVAELSSIGGASSPSGIPDTDLLESLNISAEDTLSSAASAQKNADIDLSDLDPSLAQFFMDEPSAQPNGPSLTVSTPSTNVQPSEETPSSNIDLDDIPDIEEVVDSPDETPLSSQDILSDTPQVSENIDSASDVTELDDFSADTIDEAMDLTPNIEEAPITPQNPIPSDIQSDDLQPIDDFALPQDDLQSMDDISTPEPLSGPEELSDTVEEIPNTENPPDESENIFDTESINNDSSQTSSSEDDFSLPDFDSDIASIDSIPTQESQTDESNIDDAPIEDFSGDVPEDNIDFSSDVSSDIGDDQFSIPGFSDFELDDGSSMPSVSTPDFGKATNAKGGKDKPRNAITDNEYKIFLANIKEYPLNLRIVLEDFIVKNEFTDEAVIDVIEKVIKKIPARQLASHLEKLLDVTISVPRDFERRTVAQYEAYKSSIEYQVKNRIVPGLIISGILAVCGILLFFFINRVIYRPLLAEGMYKEGYTLLENSMYPQSESRFAEAVAIQPKKKWFFAYARGYRERKQYDRARNFYERLLERFNYNKIAGLEYANMEFIDLSNYEKAEEITRRKILDYHINDKDGLLLLGDIFLEWGTEKNPDKLEDAFQTYNELIELHGNNDLYSSRLMRYYIRTDNLRQVLPLKSYFFNKKKSLGSNDLVELSGYLLDKLYGDLPATDEYLRDYIEDVRELLERAVVSDPSIPEGQYNLARYFLYTGNNSVAESWFKTALDAFNMAQTRKPNRIRKHIDSYRMLGELYNNEQEYILAEEAFGDGITLFENEQKASSFKADKNIGLLYADMADIDYFISGDLNQALRNYQNAVVCNYDTPSVYYRIGNIKYTQKDYSSALSAFIKTASDKPNDRNVLLALGNVLSLRNDNYAAQGYYEHLVSLLDTERTRYGVLFPQIRAEQGELVDLCMKAENNLGVTLNRLAQRTGDSSMSAQAMVHLSESTRAWDALTRNQDTMVRLAGSNLAEQNIKYISYPSGTFEPAIYTAIPKVLVAEKQLVQPEAR